MERKIGERFTDSGVLLEVVEQKEILSCEGCYYFLRGCECANDRVIAGICVYLTRKDGKEVIFKQVKEEK